MADEPVVISDPEEPAKVPELDLPTKIDEEEKPLLPPSPAPVFDVEVDLNEQFKAPEKAPDASSSAPVPAVDPASKAPVFDE